MKPPYIRDDLGYAWYFKDGAIRLVLAELEDKVPPELEGKVPSDQNGYACVNLEEGIRLLNEMGYITGYDDDSHPPHGPAVPDATGHGAGGQGFGSGPVRVGGCQRRTAPARR